MPAFALSTCCATLSVVMSAPARVLDDALELDPSDHARIARERILSLEQGDTDAAGLWREESRRRIDEIEAGTADLDDWSEVPSPCPTRSRAWATTETEDRPAASRAIALARAWRMAQSAARGGSNGRNRRVLPRGPAQRRAATGRPRPAHTTRRVCARSRRRA